MKGEFSDMELEARLMKVLAKLPDAPVASNFTARVLQAIDLEESRSARKWTVRRNWHALLPRVAIAAIVIGFAGLGFHRHELAVHRAVLAKNVALVATAQPLPSVDALKNFDVIQRMSQPRADEELLALLQ
ncbi:MAG TPA: hypothetical protein VHG71_07870 [Verrucomicrobiae bacterium]|nr:hypothetical protein [Verrucomicrobiae bacterium]